MSAESDLVVTSINYTICLLDWAGEVALDGSSLELWRIAVLWSAWQGHMWLFINLEMAAWVVEAAVVLDQAGL